MEFLKNVILDLPEYKNLLKFVGQSRFPLALTGLSGSQKVHIMYSLISQKNRRALVIAADEAEAQRMANDFVCMGAKALVYCSRDFNFIDVASRSREYEHQRIKVLSKMADEDYDVIISCMDAALQYTMPKHELQKRTLVLKNTQSVALNDVVDALIASGYERYEQVDGVGQFSVRGGILDFFPPDSKAPVRVEFWGDDIDTMSYFDVETQRRTDNIEKITISPATEVIFDDRDKLIKKIESIAVSLKGKQAPKAKEMLRLEAERIKSGLSLGQLDKYIPVIYEKPETLFDYLAKENFIFLSEPTKIKDRVRSSEWQWGEDIREFFEDGVLCRGLDKYQEDLEYALDRIRQGNSVYLDTFVHGGYDVPLKEIINFTCRQLSTWGGSINLLCEDLQCSLTPNTRCVVLAGTERSAVSVANDLRAKGINAEFLESCNELPEGKVVVMPGSLSAGFEYPSISFLLITHGHFNQKISQKRRKNKNAKDIYSLAELSVGDYVVHSLHGIGIFEGIHKIDMQGILKDYIKVKYAKGDVLYVPVTQLDMVSKYIGPKEDVKVKLSKMGGAEWQKTKTRVKKAVKDIAKELIRLYSERMRAKGHAFSPDNEWQRDFESHFEYEETADQLACIQEIKSDMEREAPMDRLLCGDVGFGKTEVALRAAFKCVTDSKQCALLVPTTILAWQHYQTASKRFEGFPIRVELLSRFRTQKQQKDILERLKRGEIDMLIGTHRIVQKDVEFRDLGLVIIDEEQRFGVAQKERFKEVVKNVDVLTLSATPIPRTLNMAMSGIRDMSNLEEAPQDRHPVQTYVLEHDQGIINEAIRKELRRGGQVYYLHNNVESIERVAASLQQQIPEARVGFGHGKMSESELSDIWRKVMEQEIDVLVCTTIIETGVDIPNVNTLIIDNADHMGLSQLHQIRGRVGRSSRRAYAYLTFTKNKVLTEISQKRLSAIREFTEFGSGFKIAMRDLELRGAGNILGGEQHGHMEDVGYEMYLKLLGEAVSEEKGEKVENYEDECLVDIQVQAHIPENYIKNLSQRLDIYRRISDIRKNEDAFDVIDELIDRFGDPPASVRGLIDVALIRNTAAAWNIYEIKQHADTLLLYQHNVDMQQVASLVNRFKNRVMVNAGAKPYISVKMESGSTPIDTLTEIFSIKISQTN